MNAIIPRRVKFDEFDRVTINGVHYKSGGKDGNTHLLQRFVGSLPEEVTIPVTDDELATYFDRRNIRVEPGYFSRAHAELIARNEGKQLLALSEAELRTIDWKVAWCTRFMAAKANPNYAIAVKRSKKGLADFIDLERDHVDRWYFRKYGERRGPGRSVAPAVNDRPGQLVVKERKPYDYPSPSTLNYWLTEWLGKGRRREAFILNYHRSGNRNQLPLELQTILATVVEGYKDKRRPTKDMIFRDLEVALKNANAGRQVEQHLKVSDTTVMNRIRDLVPFEVEVGREGERRARRFALVGAGNEATEPMQRIEMDDWEVDLFAHAMTSKDRDLLAKVGNLKTVSPSRFTLTIAIDCATRCVVGFHVSPHAPSTPAVKAAISTILNSKQGLVDLAKCKGDWPMGGKPGLLVTDGGPVFDNEEIDYTVAQCHIRREIPEKDERKRGTIEAFFRAFKVVCRHFAGQSFASVAELGDYKGQDYATQVFEEFLTAAVTWIVDIYHRRPHRGLEYFTPYSRWEELVPECDMRPVPDTAQQLVAFGFKLKLPVTADKHGILYMGLSYSSQAFGVLLRQAGYGAKVQVVVNPNDIGSLLVHVANERHREAIERAYPGALLGEFIEIATLPEWRGVTLSDRLMSNAAVLAMAKESQDKGKAFRIEGYERLFLEGGNSVRLAGLLTHGLTQKQAEEATTRVEWLSGAGMNKMTFADEQREMTEGSFGQQAAVSSPTAKGKSAEGKPPGRGNSKPVSTPKASAASDATPRGTLSRQVA